MRVHRNHPSSQSHEEGRLPMISSDLYTYDLDQHPLPPPAVELPVEDPLPGTKDFGEPSA